MRRLVAVVLMAVGLATASVVYAADVQSAGGAGDGGQQVLVMLNLPPPHFRPDGNYAAGYADAAGTAARRRVAAALASRHGLSLVTSWPMPVLGLECYVMSVPLPNHADDMATALASDPRVVWAQPMNVFRALGHDDPLFALQPAAREWHLGELHATATGRGVRVAVIDSAVQLDHPDLVGQAAMSADFLAGDGARAEGHGTAVAGIIAARADNHIGIVGVAPDARLLALRACREVTPAETICTTFSLALALHDAIDRGAQIVNLSLGGPQDRLIRQLVETAIGRGVVVVAAADRSLPRGGFPAELAGVVAVVDETSGPTPSGMVAAPGTDVPATVPVSRWAMVSGASFAAAHVSGLLALMLETQAHSHLARATFGLAPATRADGTIDACTSLLRAGAACACACDAVAEVASPMAPR
ncbi:MAG TPA: S8 family serine peptidase [Caldimonas sp.]|jgi:subtilisin family serine protease|nr:S8 family serine peptidase [Caldimonas sp.]HEX4235449.1 S8 family serine peptidase [Caldimonas sp.]